MIHLLHPAFVHFSIALLFLGGLWEAWGQLTGGATSIRRGGIMTIAGTLSLLPTLVTGYLAANSVPVPESAKTVFSLHELNGWVVAALFVGLLFWKGWYRGTVPESQRRFYAMALLLGVLLVGYGAFLGGDLVYMHGVGVKKNGDIPDFVIYGEAIDAPSLLHEIRNVPIFYLTPILSIALSAWPAICGFSLSLLTE